eukprot:gene2906-4749_t
MLKKITPQKSFIRLYKYYGTLTKKVEENIGSLSKIGPKRVEAFNSIGVNTIEDIIKYYPRDYVDMTEIISISDISDHHDGKVVSFLGKMIDYDQIRIKNRSQPIGILKIQQVDKNSSEEDDNQISAYFFRGNSYLRHEIKDIISKNLTIWFKGKVSKSNSKLTIIQPEFYVYENLDFQILPIYKKNQVLSKSGIGQKSLLKLIQQAIQFSEIREYLPTWILKKYNLIGIRDAYTQIHFPNSIQRIEEAKKRLKFDECIFLQLFYSNIKYNNEVLGFKQLGKQNLKLKGIGKYTQSFLDSLSFPLTKGQKDAIHEIINDVKSGLKMNRLLQGDVGCGKTIVGIVSLLLALDSGYQGIFVAPTQVLAEQHYSYLLNFLKKENVKLLIGGQSKNERNEILESLESGESKICVCTQTILNENLNFQNIGMLVIDEFCKFGVAQRQIMLEKGVLHLLLMSATPIPRSLGMTKYADLKITTINDVPKERKPIKTSIINENEREKMLNFLKSELENGHQAYIVYPFIDENENVFDLKSAKESFKNLSKNSLFEKYNIGLVHGKLSLEEKENEMRKFKNKETDILIATTVIEVGIDVPNATVMVIENSERYGLSQLHQLRGRVGRGIDQSYCLLMKNENKMNEESNERLEIICATNDGFKISEMDLKLRGPGDLLGLKQSGNLKTYLKLTKLPKENEILEHAKHVVENLYENDSFFKNFPILAEKYRNVVKDWKYGNTS